jgi:hypothetical protein
MDFDRADVDVVANLDDSPKKPSAAPAASEELADASRRPRWLRVVGKHITVLEVVIVSILGAIASGAAVLLMSFAAGSSIGEIVVTAALVGMVAAGAGFLLALRILGRDEAHGLDNLMAERGLTLRVRVHSREQESLAAGDPEDSSGRCHSGQRDLTRTAPGKHAVEHGSAGPVA